MDSESNTITTSVAIELDSQTNETLKALTDKPTNNVQVELRTINQEEINNRFGSSTNAAIAAQLRPSNSMQVMARLMQVATSKKRDLMIYTFLTCAVLIAISVGCFVVSDQNALKDDIEAVALALGIIFVVLGIITFIVSWFYCCAYVCCPHDRYDVLNKNIIKMILLEGEIWERQVDVFQLGNLPVSVNGYLCTNIYSRLKMRQYGHIILAAEGIIIDEFLTIMYEKYIVLNIDILTYNETQSSFILQLCLTARYYHVKQGYDPTPVIFHLNIIMPPEFQLHDVNDIAQNIRVNSQKCLYAVEFYR